MSSSQDHSAPLYHELTDPAQQPHSREHLAQATPELDQQGSPAGPSLLSLPPTNLPLRTAQSTPMTSPGLFSPASSRLASILPPTSISEASSPIPSMAHPHLHPLQSHKVRETHKALIDSDNITGRKLINQYEVIEEIGRGMHGKVKLARNIETGDNVAIKIIPRFSKKRRLGKVTAQAPQDKTKKEIAILKKIRHPNVVALIEVIDDPELKKIYMILEHVELGEIMWRKKGLPHICQFERRRIEREMNGEPFSMEEEKYDQILERRQYLRDMKRTKLAQRYPGPMDYWSVEHGAADESSSASRQSRIPSKEDFTLLGTSARSRGSSRAASRAPSITSSGRAPTELEHDVQWEDEETPGPLRSNPNSATALDRHIVGFGLDGGFRARSPSMADSIISHMSSIDYNPQAHDAFADDYSYVPCFTQDQARTTFRDTLLGLEYLHWQGVVHRDIKPANLLWTKEHRVKISDFGVSYFGRPIREGEVDDTVSESEARDFDNDLELAKTVGTPAFFAPELCYTDLEQEQPKVSEQIDVWSLGVTLFCLIFARIPFLGEDEFQMFKKIAKDDVYIPTRRLKPVDPSMSPSATSLYKQHNNHPFRDDNDLEYEDVDKLLVDLLKLMLTKNPDKRIRVRDIKRHPWVVADMSNPVGWLDDTDPARPTLGQRIQVDEKDMSFAVVPLTLLERARSAVRKAVHKVVQPLVDRNDSRTRRRATSSANSSAGDSMINHVSNTPYQRADRRRNAGNDDYFADAVPGATSADAARKFTEKATASDAADYAAYDPMATVLPGPFTPRENKPNPFDVEDKEETPPAAKRSGHRHTVSSGKTPSHLWHHQHGALQTTPVTPRLQSSSSSMGRSIGSLREARTAAFKGEASRARSMDRGLFVSVDKHASAQAALSPALASGNVLQTKPAGRVGRDLETQPTSSSPLSLSPQKASRAFNEALSQNNARSETESLRQNNQASTTSAAPSPNVASPPPPHKALGSPYSSKPVPPNPAESPRPPRKMSAGSAQEPTAAAAAASSSVAALPNDNRGAAHAARDQDSGSPRSPVVDTQQSSDAQPVFRSDPSLPALLSGASSISVDLDSEPAPEPDIVPQHAALLETTDSLTPPALSKEQATDLPLDDVFSNARAMDSGSVALHLGTKAVATAAGDRANHAVSLSEPVSGVVSDSSAMADVVNDDDGDDDSGSDGEVLIMAKTKNRPHSTSSRPWSPGSESRRRDTNASIASTDTAKILAAQVDES